ncbi:MAG: hypothetical protein HQK55_04425 [Deltaproteobacteria bacterium]|nr:hypothetical protein [Deltaproteobacteria bacterium]
MAGTGNPTVGRIILTTAPECCSAPHTHPGPNFKKTCCCQTKECCQVRTSPTPEPIAYGLATPPMLEQPAPADSTTIRSLSITYFDAAGSGPFMVYYSPPIYELTSTLLI